MKINQEQIKSVMSLTGPQRYEHFIKVVVDWGEVWGLFDDGWAMANTDTNEQVFPLWPAKEYAALCAEKEWEGYEPTSFTLDDLIEELLPKLEAAGVLPAIFYTPSDKGVTPTVERLLEDINIELEKY